MKNHWVETIEIYEEKLTESYQEIIDNNQIQKVAHDLYNECIFCKIINNNHKEDCIVSKAEEWIEG